MKPDTLLPELLRAPFPLRNGPTLAPRAVFVASLSLAALSQQATANQAVTLPAVGGLDSEFRCVLGDGGLECPLFGVGSTTGVLELPGPSSKYLEFTALDSTGCEYPPITLSGNTNGIGVWGCFDEFPSIDSSFSNEPAQSLLIEVMDVIDEGLFVNSSFYMDGIYLSGLVSDNSGLCSVGEFGTVTVTFADETTDPIVYTSDDSSIEGECEFPGEHDIFVDFGGPREVVSILVTPEAGGVYAAGLEIPDVSPDICNGVINEAGDCEVQVGDPGLDGGDLRAIIPADELVGSVTVEGGPWRIEDPRTACAATPSGAPEPLVFNTVETYLIDGSTTPATLPLLVQDNTATSDQFFTIQATSCGIPRMTFDGPPVARGTAGSKPFIDIVELGTDIVPEASVVGFESDGLDMTDYECQDVLAMEDASILTQPIIELNARPDEIKLLDGVPGTTTEIARDITTGCGSKRGDFKQFSYVGWNMVHADGTDMAAEIAAEVKDLVEASMRYSACVPPAFYYGQLAPWSNYIAQYYNAGVFYADASNPAFAAFYFSATVSIIDLFKAALEAPGVSNNFQNCFATGANLDEIKNGAVDPVVAGDLPYNAFGDIISLLEHLGYQIRTYEDELLLP